MSWFSKKKGRNTLVVDISSGGTGAALVCTHHGNVPEIITRTRSPFPSNAFSSSDTLEKTLLESLRSTLSSIVSELPNLKRLGLESTIDQAIVTLSSPWVESKVKTIEIVNEKSFVFDRSALMKILDDERAGFSSKLSNYFAEESEIFESAVMDLYLNGYIANEPVREKVSKAEVSFILSATTKEFLKRIEDELNRVAHFKDGIVVHSFMYVFYKVLSHSFNNLSSALLINMTSDASDLLFIKHGGTSLSASLPFGPDMIAAAIGEKFNVPTEISESYLSLFAEGVLDQKTTEEIDKVITERETSWRSLWDEVGNKMINESEVPYSVFLLAPYGFGRISKIFLENIFPNKNIILVGETNRFTQELVKGDLQNIGDENVVMLASFSNLIN